MRKHYIALVQAGPSACSVSFPDFPGLVTAARTIDAAVERAGEALVCHVEDMLKDGETIPLPCSFEDVKKFAPNYRDVMLVLGPLLPPSTVSKPTSLSHLSATGATSIMSHGG